VDIFKEIADGLDGALAAYREAREERKNDEAFCVFADEQIAALEAVRGKLSVFESDRHRR